MFTLPLRSMSAAPVRDRLVPRFDLGLRARGSAPAIVGRTWLSYAELADRVDDVAARLAAPQRRLVHVQAGNDVGSLIGYLGAMASGHVVLLTSADDNDAFDTTYRPDALVRPSAAGEVTVERHDERPARELHPDLALLLSTSGSTGSPKLVRLSADNLRANAASIVDYLGIRPTDRAALTLPMHYCYGLSIVHSNLLAGAALMIDDRSVVDECFWNEFVRCEATSISGVPYTFELLDHAGFAERDLPSLRYVTQAGGRLAPETVARYARLGESRGWQLFVMYGQTEATARMGYLPPDLASTRPEAIGIPIPGGDFTIDDGELVYRGDNVMLGYATSADDLALGRTVTELRTGDLAVQADDGLYELTGRKARFVKLFGLRVDLDRVEAALAAGGVDARVAGDDARLVVAVTSAHDRGAVTAAVRTVVDVPPSSIAVLLVDGFPRLLSGKVDYDAIRRSSGTTPADPQPPYIAGACDERAIADLFARVLDARAVDASDTFVGLGGDSLSYVEMSISLEARIAELPTSWPTMTVAELAALCRRPNRKSTVTRGSRTVETNVLLRAVAIVVIVGSHTSFMNVRGGAHVLLAVAGFNAARFHLARVGRSATDAVRGLAASVARVALPAAAWVGAWVALTDRYSLANVLMVNTITGPTRWGERWQYWFIEVLVHILVGLALLLVVPPVRRLVRSRGFEVAVALTIVGLALRYDAFGIANPERLIHRVDSALWFFTIGWAAFLASSTKHRIVVTALLAIGIPHYFESGRRESYVAVGVLALIWMVRVRFPAALLPAVRVLAASSLYVYLTHWQLYPAVAEATSPLVALLASLATGAAAWWVVERASGAAGRLSRRVSLRRRGTAGAALASAA